MKELKLDEIKKIMLEMLNDFTKFCDENKLRYTLAYGTLLGAVRHKGFIPWDDDIDIIMPRSDYCKFVKLTQKGINKNFEVISMEKDFDYIYPFVKVVDKRTLLFENDVCEKSQKYGVYIDVFPMDGLPKENKLIEKHYRIMSYYKKIHDLSVTNKKYWNNIFETIVKRTIISIIKLYGYKRIVCRMNKLAQRYEFEKSDKIGVVIWGYGLKEVTTKSKFMNFIQLEFENNYYNAPANYDEYLTKLYGSYMELPPKKKRVTNHSYTVVWK